MVEAKDPLSSLKILQQCLAILRADYNDFLERFPKRNQDVIVIERRIAYMEKKLKINTDDYKILDQAIKDSKVHQKEQKLHLLLMDIQQILFRAEKLKLVEYKKQYDALFKKVQAEYDKIVAKIKEEETKFNSAKDAKNYPAMLSSIQIILELAPKVGDDDDKAHYKQDAVNIEAEYENTQKEAAEQDRLRRQKEAEERQRLEAERLAKEEAERKALEEAERKMREEQEAKRKAEEEAKAKAEEEARLKAEEEAKAKAEEEARLKAEEEAKVAANAILTKTFSDLRNNANVEYDQYLSFFQKVNQEINQPFPKIIRDSCSKIYYVGDTHGSYAEALILIEYFEKIIAADQNVKIVFLGDYVDRNPQDLENLTVILGFYLAHKNNVVLLRGNHEDKLINQNYGFMANLRKKFKELPKINEIYREIMHFFTLLPLVHLNAIENNTEKNISQIFAVHGGIPVNIKNPKSPVILSEIESSLNQSAETYSDFDLLMNWMLWADPNEEIEGTIYDPETGRSQFGLDAFQQFMEANNCQIMVRGHEKFEEGFRHYFNGKLISIFSTSFYSGVKFGNAKILRIEKGKDSVLLPILTDDLNQDIQSPK